MRRDESEGVAEYESFFYIHHPPVFLILSPARLDAPILPFWEFNLSKLRNRKKPFRNFNDGKATVFKRHNRENINLCAPAK